MSEGSTHRRSESSPFPSEDDDDKSHSSHSSKEPSAIGQTMEDEELAIAKEEDLAVFKIRLAVAVSLFFCTVSVGCIVYINTRNQEQTLFQSDFEDFSMKVLGTFGNTLHQSIAALDIYAVECTSYAKSMNMTWPFVFLPNSATRFSKVLRLAKASLVSVIPVVAHSEREEWDVFSMKRGPEWVENNLRVQTGDPGFTGTKLEEYSISPLWGLGGPLQNQSRYFPVWQQYPTASSIGPAYNIDFQTKEAISFKEIEEGVVQISNVFNDPVFNTKANFFFRDFVGSDLDVTEPFCDCYYPVFENAPNSVSVQDRMEDSIESDMVAFLSLTFHWRNQLLNTLPLGIDGLVLVVSTTCNSTFTYEINGPDVNFLGYGDHHDLRYDHMTVESNLLELLSLSSPAIFGSHLPISQEICAYTFRIFPSEKFEGAYISNDPWIYTSIADFIFVFTSAVFWFYDSLIERRQRKVMSSAVTSSAIVSSLFPSNVRDRLYDFDGTHAQPAKSRQLFMKQFISSEDAPKDAGKGTSAGTQVLKQDSPPIADLFPEVTVMFAYIAGCNTWSSTREPSQVFLLLESVYGLFDKLASKRKIFKVETIGDSYLAVAGLPDSRSDHAVVMAKFASECCIQMSTLMAKLCESLGPGTESLSLRCGLNSGPVTAGVLRGQKTRFQLFGDTVNMASRMESTGEKNRIQASPSTAKELIKHNKGNWLHSRQDRVHVKGKGSTITYWVVPHKRVESSSGGEHSTFDHV